MINSPIVFVPSTPVREYRSVSNARCVVCARPFRPRVETRRGRVTLSKTCQRSCAAKYIVSIRRKAA